MSFGMAETPVIATSIDWLIEVVAAARIENDRKTLQMALDELASLLSQRQSQPFTIH